LLDALINELSHPIALSKRSHRRGLLAGIG
jgi:hypothetical protein